MLHWLAGQRQSESDDNSKDEPPETPAPLFAVRAFKQAIFGTPATAAHARQRRSSNADKDFARPTTRPTRPALTRPKSANDATTSTRILDFPASPTKGILLTPGTAGGRGKTVTFGDHVRNKGPQKSGQVSIEDTEQPRKRVNPFDALDAPERQEDTLAERRSRRKSSCCEDQLYEDELARLADEEPECATGRYWKREYDIYRDNTSKELHKLVTKQKAAKSFAREKDEQCSALTEELRRERQHVQRLENRALELEMTMKVLQIELAEKKRSETSRARRHTATDTALVSPSLEASAKVINVEANILQPNRASAVSGAIEASGHGRRRIRHDSLDPETSKAPARTQTMDATALPESDLPQTRLQHISTASIDRWDEGKENLSPPQMTTAKGQGHVTELPKSIVSREGDVIPPDRVAAARARLAARRQQRVGV